jgi:hypothetical protein
MKVVATIKRMAIIAGAAGADAIVEMMKIPTLIHRAIKMTALILQKTRAMKSPSVVHAKRLQILTLMQNQMMMAMMMRNPNVADARPPARKIATRSKPPNNHFRKLDLESPPLGGLFIAAQRFLNRSPPFPCAVRSVIDPYAISL